MKTSYSCAAASTAALFLASSLALASPHSDEEQVCTENDFLNCLNGVTSSVTNGASLRASSADLAEVARERSGKKAADAQAALFGSHTGLPAGDEMGNSVFGMWGSYSYSDFDSDFTFQGAALNYDADMHSGLIGFDRLFSDRFLLGMAFGYQDTEADSTFNGGRQSNDGYTIAPYAAMLLNEVFSIDVSGGFTWLDYDQRRISPVDGTRIRASFDADRWFITTNLNALLTAHNWIFGARVGYLHTEEDQDRYVETGSAASAAGGVIRTVTKRQIDLSQLIVSGDLGYNFGDWEPYFMVAYYNDLSRDNDNSAGGLPGNFTSVQAGDDDEVQLSGGIRYYTTWGVTATFEYMSVQGRKNFDSDTFMFTLRAAL